VDNYRNMIIISYRILFVKQNMKIFLAWRGSPILPRYRPEVSEWRQVFILARQFLFYEFGKTASEQNTLEKIGETGFVRAAVRVQFRRKNLSVFEERQRVHFEGDCPAAQGCCDLLEK